ncbi:CBO2463/CBO2479 domain-containing protein [Sporomusa rhizae]|uniref:CBO2463/CBO2479 domain-containing protein n=1 Tax=Sporomusa rhizae TaxID=357999 RepID=UPI00352A233A
MEYELNPRLLKGKLVEITDVGVKIAINGRLGVLNLPLRFIISDNKLQIDDEVEFYLSYVRVSQK